jgi:hypothetical protein
VTTRAHINSSLYINTVLSIDRDNTIFLAHYDISPTDVFGSKPYDSDITDMTILHYNIDKIFYKNQNAYILDKSKWSTYGKINGDFKVERGMDKNAVVFNGNTVSIECVNVKRLNSIVAHITIETWIYPTGYGVIISKGNPFVYIIDISQDGNTSFKAKVVDDNIIEAKDESVLELNKWHYIAGVYDGSEIRLYIDGVLKGSTPCINKLIHNEQPIIIGAYNDYNKFSGKLDMIAIHDAAMSEAEIKRRHRRSLYSISDDGKFGGALLIEDKSANLLKNPANFTIEDSIRYNEALGLHGIGL